MILGLQNQNCFINIKFVDNCNPLKFQEINFPSTYSQTFLKNNLDEQFVFYIDESLQHWKSFDNA
jgi:hypothetical protein